MRPTSFLAVFLLLALPLGAANLTFVDRPFSKTLPIDVAGTLWIDNPFGTIEISGVDGANATITAVRTTIAVDRDSMAEARENTVLSFEGDTHQRIVRTIIPPLRSQRWSSSVKYMINVPRTVHVRVATKVAETVRIVNVMGNVTVKAFAALIILDNVTGASIVDSVNGRVVYNYPSKPVSVAQVNTINGSIEIHMPADANVDWIASSARGDIWTTLPLHGRWQGTVFRGNVNAPGGPQLTTATMLGRVALLGNGATGAEAQSVASLIPQFDVGNQRPASTPQMMRVQLASVPGPMEIVQRIADINIGEARGPLRVITGAGAIELGTVYGDCIANSAGGAITITEAKAGLNAHSGGGDILVRTARTGGTITTDGGTIKVEYTGGPTTLKNAAGDIIVRQAAGPIDAETRSGDIAIGADPNHNTQRITARTARGNVTLHLPPRFAADVDATVLTSDNDSDAIFSDFKGLQIRKEQVGGKTRVHATGKINGGGERLELYAENGTIHINAGLRW